MKEKLLRSERLIKERNKLLERKKEKTYIKEKSENRKVDDIEGIIGERNGKRKERVMNERERNCPMRNQKGSNRM